MGNFVCFNLFCFMVASVVLCTSYCMAADNLLGVCIDSTATFVASLLTAYAAVV